MKGRVGLQSAVCLEASNEVSDYDMEECSLSDDCDFDNNYTKTVIPGTHTISDSNSGYDREQKKKLTRMTWCRTGRGVNKVCV